MFIKNVTSLPGVQIKFDLRMWTLEGRLSAGRAVEEILQGFVICAYVVCEQNG